MTWLTIQDCSAETLEISADVDDLYLQNVDFPTFPVIPTRIKHLRIDNCRMADGSPIILHEGLESVHIGMQSNPFHRAGDLISPPITTFPSSLQSLVLRKIRTTAIPGLPDALKNARFRRLTVQNPVILPTNLRSLYLDECSLQSFLAFPAGLRRLAIIECDGHTLPDFPAGLRQIQLSDLQLDYIPAIPASCTEYIERFVEVEQRNGHGGHGDHEEDGADEESVG